MLKNKLHRYRFTFGQSIAASKATDKGLIYPTAYDVLACLQKYEITTFEDFCIEFGYDVDSRKAYKTYKAVKREWENVKKLFSDEQLELLREIQ